MEIRYINQSDDPSEISNIYENSWKYAYRDMIPQEYLNSIPAGHWARSIHTVGMNTLILMENGMMIGTASFCQSRMEEYSDYGEIVSIYLMPDYMGKGYGTLLLGKCMDELKRCGFDKILLWVLEENHRARRFYEKNGLICTKIFKEDTIGGKKLREVLYRLDKLNDASNPIL